MAKAFYLLFLGKAVGNVPLEVPLQNRTVRQTECNLCKFIRLNCIWPNATGTRPAQAVL